MTSPCSTPHIATMPIALGRIAHRTCRAILSFTLHSADISCCMLRTFKFKILGAILFVIGVIEEALEDISC